MKAILLFISFFVFITFSSAQINSTTPWTWMKGDNTIEQLGVYGTQGIAANSNKPGARNFSTTWRDASGNLWLFGGRGYETSSLGYLNDLWKYSTATNMWTWVKGDNVVEQYSIYGVLGTANIANKPGATYSSVSWTDASGNLWLFGGFGYTNNDYGFLNTLWKFNPSTNTWTWMKGDKAIDKTGIYGTQGTANIANKPGARYGSQTWIDGSGNLWLFGGYGYDGTSVGILNDLWKYTPSANKWTWVKGDNIVGQTGNYNTKGLSNAANKPGGRYVSSSWSDASGNLWLFGGYGYAETGSGNLNDLWKYNPSSNEWTWVNGDKSSNQAGIYGFQGVSNASNKPGARYVSTSWIDANGSLWLFGGSGYDGNSSGNLNDLWKYNTANDSWTWIKGDSTVDHVGIYGTQGMGSPFNKSGARNGSVSWTDGNGNLWLFGGYGFDGSTSGVLNDLWRISNLQGVLPLHLLQFNGVLNNNAVQLRWTSEQETNFSHFNIQRSFDGINFSTVADKNGSGNSDKNDYMYSDDDLKNHTVQKVFYRLQLMNKDGSYTYSKVLVFNLNEKTSIQLFPNPAIKSLNISLERNKPGKVIIDITDMNGSVVKKQTENVSSGRVSINMDISLLVAGTYLISIKNGDENLSLQKFIKQ